MKKHLIKRRPYQSNDRLSALTSKLIPPGLSGMQSLLDNGWSGVTARELTLKSNVFLDINLSNITICRQSNKNSKSIMVRKKFKKQHFDRQ